MNRFSVASDTDQLGSMSAYAVLQSKSEGLLSSSWEKFISRQVQQQERGFVQTAIPTERITTEGPMALKAASYPHSDEEQTQRNLALFELLRSWHEDDELEEPESWERLKQALDEDRLSDRKLFP